MKIYEYFALVSAGTKLFPESNEFEDQKIITSIQLFIGYVGFNQNKKLVCLNPEKDTYIALEHQEQGKKPIEDIALMKLEIEDDYIIIPNSIEYVPCTIVYNQNGNQQIFYDKIHDIKADCTYYKGICDISKYLDLQPTPTKCLVLCYKLTTKSKMPIVDIDVFIAEKKKQNEKDKQKPVQYQLCVPKYYRVLQPSFGDKNQKFIGYTRKQHPLSLTYKSFVQSHYPKNDRFPSQITMFCFPDGVSLSKTLETPTYFQFLLTSEQGKRSYCTCLKFYEKVSPSQQAIVNPLFAFNFKFDQYSRDQIYQKVAICLSLELLKFIYQYSQSKNSLPIERVICNIIDEITIPYSFSELQTQVTVYEGNNKIYFPTYPQFPYCSDKCITTLFTLLDIENIILLFTGVLLEKKIHLLSSRKAVSGLIVEALTTLIFPLEYTHMLIPVMPEVLKMYKDAPLPYLIGYQHLEQTDSSLDYLYVFLDKNSLLYFEEISSAPHTKSLHKKLMKYSKIYSPEKAIKYIQTIGDAFPLPSFQEEEDIIDTQDIRQIFLDFMIGLLKDYQKYMLNSNSYDLNDIFRVKDFLSHYKSDFMQKFVETRLFSFFIQERNQLTENEPYLDFFDDCIKDSKKSHFNLSIEDKKINQVMPPNNHGIDESKESIDYINDIFVYSKFPLLQDKYFIKARVIFKQNDDGLTLEKIPSKFNNLTGEEWVSNIYVDVYKIWFLLFIIKIRENYLKDIYQKLVEYALTIMNKLILKRNNISEVQIRYILEACGYFRMDEKALKFITILKNNGYLQYQGLETVYFQAVQKSITHKGLKRKHMAKLSSLNSENEIIQFEQHSIGIIYQKPSTDNLSKILSSSSHQLGGVDDHFMSTAFTLKNKCSQCSKKYSVEQVFASFYKGVQHNQVVCFSCKQKTHLKMQVINSEKEEEEALFSPTSVFYDLENLIQNQKQENLISEFLEKINPTLFTNIIFYFNLFKLPFFFLMNQIEELEYKLYFKMLDKQIQMLQQRKSFHYQQNYMKLYNYCDIYATDIQMETQEEMTNEDCGDLNEVVKYINKYFGDFIKDWKERTERKVDSFAKSSLSFNDI